MKETFLSRFTPSMMKPEALEAIFVQHKRKELALRLVELIRDSALTEAKHHTLLVGPRGIGKTHLVSLIYHRVRQMEDLRGKLVIAWLREEEWGVASFLDLLLRIFRALQDEYGDEALAARIESLYEQPPDAAVRAAAALLKDFVGERALLVIVENLDELFTGLGSEGQKQLRSYLQENPFCTILATSQSLFSGVSLQTSPFYGFFRITHLEDLTLEEATQLLMNIATLKGDRKLASFIPTPTGRARIRAVRHMAGGNHRVYVIFSQFLTRESLDKLVEPFMRMLDDLTPYYQARMQWLSPQQRKIVEFLCERRGAVTVKEIAQRSFVTHQTASGQLKTLREMGYVQAESVGRESYYELREPLMRLSVEVKKHRNKPIRLFVDFLRLWHTISELQQQLASLKTDAGLDREYLLNAIKINESEAVDPRLASCTKDLIKYLKAEDYIHALEVAEELVEIRVDAIDWFVYGHILSALERDEEAIEKLNRAVELNPTFGPAYAWKGSAFKQLGRYEDSLKSYDKAIELGISDADMSWGPRGEVLLHLGRFDDALFSFEKVLETNRDHALGWSSKAYALSRLGRFDEAIKSSDKAIELEPESDTAWVVKGFALAAIGRYTDAVITFDRATEIDPTASDAFFGRITSLIALDRWDEGFAALDHAFGLFSDRSIDVAWYSKNIVSQLFTRQRDVEVWRLRAGKLAEIYGKHNYLPTLGHGIAQNIYPLMSPMVSDSAAREWRDVWQGIAEQREELKLPIRLLDAAVRYRETKDQRVLLELPTEERALLEEALNEASDSDE